MLLLVALAPRTISPLPSPVPVHVALPSSQPCVAHMSELSESENHGCSEEAAESGWDFSSRWLADGASLASAQTSEVLPVDLNAIMYRVETNLQRLCAIAGDTEEAMRYGAAAQRRERR